jgi:DNA-directed RNA polymerase subunit K/omega
VTTNTRGATAVTEPSKPESEYLFVEISALRCMQLMRGAKPKIDAKAHKYTTLAVQEVEASTVPWTLEEPKPDEVAAVDDDTAEVSGDEE